MNRIDCKQYWNMPVCLKCKDKFFHGAEFQSNKYCMKCLKYFFDKLFKPEEE